MRLPAALLATLLLAVPAGQAGHHQDDAAPEAPVAWGDPATAPIRPGASLGGYCTFNFLFTDDTGSAYIGTAGHCTDEIGERVRLGGTALTIGTVVYDSDTWPGAAKEVDFALVRLDPEDHARAHPRMLGWGGPTGIAERDDLALGTPLGVYGYGIGVGLTETTRARAGVLVGTTEEQYTADMPAVNGDSGGPIVELDSGRAVGMVSHYGLGATPPSTDEGPLMTFVMRELAYAGFHVELALDAA